MKREPVQPGILIILFLAKNYMPLGIVHYVSFGGVFFHDIILKFFNFYGFKT